MHVKKGDTVLVISGNDRGKSGEVKEAMPRENRVVVEGINLRWKHKKPSQQTPKGERLQRETPINASNVKRVDAAPTEKKAAKKKAAKKAPAASGDVAEVAVKKSKKS